MGNMTDIIGSNPLAQSLQNRGLPLSVLAQSPASMGFQPDLQYPGSSPALPNKSPMTAMGQFMQSTQPQAPQQPQSANPPGVPTVQPGMNAPQLKREKSEAEVIIHALNDRLKALTNTGR